MMCYYRLFLLLTIIQIYPACAQYRLTVKTGLSWAAGTDATVKIRLGAESGNFSENILLKNNRNNFEHAGTDRFTLDTEYLGPICHVTVWMVNKGLFADWQLAQIILHDNITSGKSIFNFHRWMKPEENETAQIHGGWSKWSPWSECSQSCGGERKVRTRVCDRPPPACGGKDCKGRTRQRKLCGKEKCTTTTAPTPTTTTTTRTTTTTPTTTTSSAHSTTTTEITTTLATATTTAVRESPPSTNPVIYVNSKGRVKNKTSIRFSLTLPPLIMPPPAERTTAAALTTYSFASTTRIPATTIQTSRRWSATLINAIPDPVSTNARKKSHKVGQRTRVVSSTTPISIVPKTATANARTWWVSVSRQWKTTARTTTPQNRRPYYQHRYPTTRAPSRYDWRQRPPRPTYHRRTTTYRPFLRLPIEERFPYPRRTTTTPVPVTTEAVPFKRHHASSTQTEERRYRPRITMATPHQRWRRPTKFRPTYIPKQYRTTWKSHAKYTEVRTLSKSSPIFRTTTTQNLRAFETKDHQRSTPPPPPTKSVGPPDRGSVGTISPQKPDKTVTVQSKVTTTTLLTTTLSSSASTTQSSRYPKIKKLRTSVEARELFTKQALSPDGEASPGPTEVSRRELDVTIRSRIIQKDSPTQDRHPSTHSNNHPPVRSVMGESRRQVLPVNVIVIICISGVVVISVVIVIVYCAVIKSKLGSAAVTAAANSTIQPAVPVQTSSYPMTVKCVPR